ncbi:hypothetical protein CANINC_001345 [Pichia inconspicua]|uniref:Uncharacterized protein n=1 Tax=Pichia inconspicua TaxID=52247 RepID=A0A4T0X3V9_9ASCO|nr:hypothetical protein CANINC_001345 [[Candida] inconspicua]
MSFSLASFENRSSFNRVSVTSIGLIGIKQFTEARRTGYKDFKYNDLFTAAAAILKMDMYTIYKASLMYYSLKHPVSVNLIKQKFFDVTPDHFVPTAEDIKHFIEEPQFMYRFSLKNYNNIKSLFKKSHPSFAIDIYAITKDDSELVPYLKSKRTQLKENLKSKLHLLKNINHDDYDFKRMQRVNEMFTFQMRAEESSNFLFSSDFYLHMMAPQCDFHDFLSTLLIGFSPKYHGGLYRELLLQQNEKLQLANFEKKNLKKNAKGKTFVDPSSFCYPVENNSKKLKVPKYVNLESLKLSSKKFITSSASFKQNSLVQQISENIIQDACQPLFDIFSPKAAMNSSVGFLREQREAAVLRTLPTNALPYLGQNDYYNGEYVYEHLKILTENYKKEVNINNHPLMLTDSTASYLTDDGVNFYSFYRLANNISKGACHIDKFKFVQNGLIHRTGWKFVNQNSGNALAAGYRAAVYKQLHNSNYTSRIFTNNLTPEEKKIINKNIDHISYNYFRLFDENHQPIVSHEIASTASFVTDDQQELLATKEENISTLHASTRSGYLCTTISTTQSLHLRYHSDVNRPIGEDEFMNSSNVVLDDPQTAIDYEDVSIVEETTNTSDPTTDQVVDICEIELPTDGHDQSNDFGDGNLNEEQLIIQEDRIVDGTESIEMDTFALQFDFDNDPNDTNDILSIIDAYETTSVNEPIVEEGVIDESTSHEIRDDNIEEYRFEVADATQTAEFESESSFNRAAYYLRHRPVDQEVVEVNRTVDTHVDLVEHSGTINHSAAEEVVSCTSERSFRLESGMSVYTRMLYSLSTPNEDLPFPFYDPLFESILSLEEQELLRYLEPRSVAMKIAYLAGFIWINQCFHNARAQAVELIKNLEEMETNDDDEDLDLILLEELSVRALSVRELSTRASRCSNRTAGSNMVTQSSMLSSSPVVELFLQNEPEEPVNVNAAPESFDEPIAAMDVDIVEVDEPIVDAREESNNESVEQANSITHVDAEYEPMDGAASGLVDTIGNNLVESNIVDEDDSYDDGLAVESLTTTLIRLQNEISNPELESLQGFEVPSDLSTSDQEQLFLGGVNNIERGSLRHRNFNSPVPSSHRDRYRREFRLSQESSSSSIAAYREMLTVPLNRLFSSSESSKFSAEHDHSSESSDNESNEIVTVGYSSLNRALVLAGVSGNEIGNDVSDHEVSGNNVSEIEVSNEVLKNEPAVDGVSEIELIDNLVAENDNDEVVPSVTNDDLNIDSDLPLANDDEMLDISNPAEGSSKTIEEGDQEALTLYDHTQKSKKVSKKIQAQFQLFEYGCDSNRN